MKIKIYLFHFVVAFMTFVFGIGLFYAWQNVNILTQEAAEVVAVQPASQPEIVVMPSPVAEMPIIETTSAPDLEQNVEYEFDAEGSYYVFSNSSESNNLPKAFEDFNEISITTADYKNASEEDDYKGVPIPPEGYLFAKREYKFVRINIANRQIAFETESKKGISYKFVGKFNDYTQSSEVDYADLEGQLIKMRDGKKIAETKVKLAVGGC